MSGDLLLRFLAIANIRALSKARLFKSVGPLKPPEAACIAGNIIKTTGLADAEGRRTASIVIARDLDFRQMGLLYYVAASSDTLGEALGRVQRHSSIVNAGVVLQCFESSNLTIALRYFGVARHSDRQQMELLVTNVIRLCRAITGRNLKPNIVRFAHRRSTGLLSSKNFMAAR